MARKNTQTSKKAYKKNSAQIKLTIPESMMKKLKQEKEKFSYESVQEVIKDVLRDKFFKSQTKTGTITMKGRPAKIDSQRILARKKIFSSKGVTIPI